MNLFSTTQASHAHSLETLNLIANFEGFMSSVETVYDFGCGIGHDAKWWATQHNRSTGDEYRYQVYGLDLKTPRAYPTVSENGRLKFIQHDFEVYDEGIKADVIWSHDSFRFVKTPIQTLANWNRMMNQGAMLAMITPQTLNHADGQTLAHVGQNNFYHYSIANLLYMLALAGFDCKGGHFHKAVGDPWIKIICYKQRDPFPIDTSLKELAEAGLFPGSVEHALRTKNYFAQSDVFTHWIAGNYCDWKDV